MKRCLKRVPVIFLAVFLLQLLFSVAKAQDLSCRKKLIATGWDYADSERLLKNLEQIEERRFDGVVIQADGYISETKRCPVRLAFADEQWDPEWFRPCIDQLKACKFKRLTDNFITLEANPGNVDWFNDRGWGNIVAHWRMAAWIAKEAGFKGILFDPEAYTRPYAQFDYVTQADRGRHTFDEYYTKARQRGREVMQAIADVYPGVTLFCYFMDSRFAPATRQPDPHRALSALRYNLYPAFIDGWLDAVPPSVTLVDGCESAYFYNSVEEYLNMAVLIKGACQVLVSPENRVKYRGQVQVGFGVYLDAYWNPKEPQWMPWYIDGKGGPRVTRLRENVRTALRVADEYVWIYGEKFRWWPTPNKAVRSETWPEALPGCERALDFARDPVSNARNWTIGKKTLAALNLARNGDFASDKTRSIEGPLEEWREGGPPAGWRTWQEKSSNGILIWDQKRGATGKGSAKAVNVANGCFLQGTSVHAGEFYAIRAVRKLQGKGDTWLRIRWQTSEGIWIAEEQDTVVFCERPRGQWGEMFGVVEVPESAARLMVLLCVSDQRSSDDIAWFDDVGLYKVE